MTRGETTNWVTQAADALEAAGVDLVAHIPDTKMAPLITEAEERDSFETVLVTREEEAVGVLSGAWVGGRRGVLLCQSSGLANTFNAFASLAVPARIPFVGIATRRGDLGEFNLAQVPAGYSMPDLLDDMGVRNHSLDEADRVGEKVQMAAESAFSTETPYVLLLESTVTGYKKEAE
jgi:sulfopyruvate decarboxylase alpha subunit